MGSPTQLQLFFFQYFNYFKFENTKAAPPVLENFPNFGRVYINSSGTT
jgi:hypothetical protein